MTDIPAPLVPADVDLRDFTFLPIDIVRLFGSDFHAKSSDGEWRAGVTLWLKSFHQVPAASLPNDDVALARLAEFGRDAKSWEEVKTGALHGWTLCSDNRWYHAVVAAKAVEGWLGKLFQRRSGAIGNAKRWNTPSDLADIDRQIAEASAALQKLAPGSPVLRKCRPTSTTDSPSQDTAATPDASQCDPTPIAVPSQPDPDPIAEGSQGKGKGKGRECSAQARDTPPESDQKPTPRRRGRRSSPETAWPPDFAFGEKLREYAADHGFPGQTGDKLFEKFEAKSLAKRWTNCDWNAAFRNFVLNEHPPPARANGGHSEWRPPDC